MNRRGWNPKVAAVIASLVWLSPATAAHGRELAFAGRGDRRPRCVRLPRIMLSQVASPRRIRVYYYSPDLQQRWGEGKANADQIWVQPPGTPTVGLALLKAYAATADQLYLDAAVRAKPKRLAGLWPAQVGRLDELCRFQSARRQNLAAIATARGNGPSNSTLDDGISGSGHAAVDARRSRAGIQASSDS